GSLFLTFAMEQLLMELANVTVSVGEADDAVDVAGNRHIAPADVANNDRAVVRAQPLGMRRQPIVVFDRGLHAAIGGQLDPHGMHKFLRISQVIQKLSWITFPEMKPKWFPLQDL